MKERGGVFPAEERGGGVYTSARKSSNQKGKAKRKGGLKKRGGGDDLVPEEVSALVSLKFILDRRLETNRGEGSPWGLGLFLLGHKTEEN